MSRGSSTAICRCPAYGWPHRWLSGACTGWTAVEAVFEKDFKCRDCPNYSEFKESHGERVAACALLTAADTAQSWAKPEACPGLDLITTGVI